MAHERERYRKLPGHRRGFLRGASLWLGGDHLLSVKSLRFREEYKRFYLRDVQAIVIANVPRFHLSTRSAVIAWLWIVAFSIARNRQPWLETGLWIIAALLVGAWFYLSYALSCRCRIYTAVSRDELPSIYRTWTARKFLAELEPRISQVQGKLEGDWAEAVENRKIGPTGLSTEVPGAAILAPSSESPNAEAEPLIRPAARARTIVSDIFVASLFADALLNIGTLHSMTRTIQWVWYGLAFIQVSGAILIFLQYHRGILKAGMQKLAIATLIVMGGAYYLRQLMTGLSGATKNMLQDPAALAKMPGYIVVREVDAALCLVLGVIGVALVLMTSDDIAQPRSIAG